MTIGFVLDDTLDSSDGVQTAVRTIGSELERRGHDVHYLVTTTKKSNSNIHSLAGYYRVRFNGNSVRMPRRISKRTLKRIFEEVVFDVLHVQMPFSPYFAGRIVAAAPAHVKIIGTFHILPYSSFVAASTKMLGTITPKKQRARLSDCFAVSEPARKFMQQTYGVAGRVLPNPIDYAFFSRYRKAHRRKKRPKTVVFVGRFDQRKGVLQLIEAFSRLPESLKAHTQLILCGKGPLYEQAQEMVERKALNALLPGFVSEEEKAQYLAAADVAVFPSLAGESFGIVLAEAMAAGAGVTIGGNNPGYASVLAPWPETLFDPTDSTAFSEKLAEALERSFAERFGGLQWDYVKQFDVTAVVDVLEATYRKT